MITRVDLQRLSKREGVALGTLEKDYVLTEVLKALPDVTQLKGFLVFKGGTALRKIYFPGWRYSEDLDFTAKADMALSEIRKGLDEWYERVGQSSGVRLSTRMIHKPNGYARVRVQFTGPLAYPGMIFMDISFDEPLCLEPKTLEIQTHPFPNTSQKVLVYPLEELLAEKMRSLIERGKSRDYYDVWRLLKEESIRIDLALMVEVLKKKVAHKGLNLRAQSDFFQINMADLRRYWENDLKNQIDSLPPLDKVLFDLQEMVAREINPYLNLKP